MDGVRVGLGSSKNENNKAFYDLALELVERHLARGYKDVTVVVGPVGANNFAAQVISKDYDTTVLAHKCADTQAGAVVAILNFLGGWAEVQTAYTKAKGPRAIVDKVWAWVEKEIAASAAEAAKPGGPRWAFEVDHDSYDVCKNLATYKGRDAWCMHLEWTVLTPFVKGSDKDKGVAFRCKAGVGGYLPRGMLHTPNFSPTFQHFTGKNMTDIQMVMGRIVAFSKHMAKCMPFAPTDSVLFRTDC